MCKVQLSKVTWGVKDSYDDVRKTTVKTLWKYGYRRFGRMDIVSIFVAIINYAMDSELGITNEGPLSLKAPFAPTIFGADEVDSLVKLLPEN